MHVVIISECGVHFGAENSFRVRAENGFGAFREGERIGEKEGTSGSGVEHAHGLRMGV